MSEKDEELSDKELNSLLSDLSSRADAGASNSAPASGKDDGGGEGEDIEAFLRSLEADEPASSSAAKPVATADANDDLAARFAELDALQPDDLPATIEKPPAEKKSANEDEKNEKKKVKKTRKEKAAEKKAAKARAKEEKEKAKAEKIKAKEEAAANAPRVKRVAKKVAKWSLMAFPMLLFAWMFGAYLGYLISAGWLIAILALLVAIGLPILLSRLVKRGKFAWWGLGLGIVLTLVLIAPMPGTAGNTLTRYGHWPATAVSEVAGWQADNALVQFNSAVAKLLGGALNPDVTAPGGPSELGTEHSLYQTANPPAPVAPGATAPQASPAQPPAGGPAAPAAPTQQPPAP